MLCEITVWTLTYMYPTLHIPGGKEITRQIGNDHVD